MLEKEIPITEMLRQPDPNYQDSREPWRYPQPKPKSDFAKPGRSISEARKDDLTSPWEENEWYRDSTDRGGVVKGAFDAKTLGGQNTIPIRRPGLQESPRVVIAKGDESKASDKTQMKFCGRTTVGMPQQVDKVNMTLLQDEPQCRGFQFDKRKPARALREKYGSGPDPQNLVVKCPPVSLNVDEPIIQAPGNYAYPFQMAKDVARPLKTHGPPPIPQKTPRKATGNASSATMQTHSSQKSSGAHLAGVTMTARDPATQKLATGTAPLTAREITKPRQASENMAKQPMSAR